MIPLRQVWVIGVLLGVHGSPFGFGEDAPPGGGILRLTIADASSTLPTACTVRIVDATGRVVIENDSFRDGLRCDGSFERHLPSGRTQIRVTRGFETRSVDQVVEVPPGGAIDVRMTLTRVVDLRRRGWYAGDSHAHMLHGERTLPVSFDFVALTARAEDLQYLSLAQDWTLANPTPEALEAELQSRSRPGCALTWNLEAPKNYYKGDASRCLGHCWTLGMQGRTPAGSNVISALLQASAWDYESDKPTFANFESHALIHSQDGVVFYTHPARWWTGAWGGRGGYPVQTNMRVSNTAVELPLDTLVGPTFDGLDVLTTGGEFQANQMAFEIWCLLLNHGYRLAATASSDACFDRPGGAVPGSVRTYTQVGPEFSLPAVARAAAAGRNFVTSGPLLLTSLDDQPPGSVFASQGLDHQLKIEAWASGSDTDGLSRVEVMRNGVALRSFAVPAKTPSLATNLNVAETGPAWYCVRVFGSDPQRQRAISGAYYFESNTSAHPAPVTARVRVNLKDSRSGAALSGSITEIADSASNPREGTRHKVPDGQALFDCPATRRLRAEAPGYQPATLSPVLDDPHLIRYITTLTADDLLHWETFERVRTLLGHCELTFPLERQDH